jgi:hypothetical protein
MNDAVILHWNVTNWITVVLMAALGFMALSLVAQGWKSYRAKAA